MYFIYGTVFAGILVFGIGMLVFRRIKMRQALNESCLLCDSEDVDILDADMGSYRCRQCHFDSDRARNPEVAPAVEDFRDLKNALDHLYACGRHMRRARSHATMDSNGKYHYLTEAGRELTEGMTLMQALMPRYPELGDNPVPGSNIDGDMQNRDVYSRNIVSQVGAAIEVHGKIKENTEQVERYVAVVKDVQDGVRDRILAQLAT